MDHIIYCRDLGFDCNGVVRAGTEEELLSQVARHAQHDHGVAEVTPELVAEVKSARRMSVERTEAVMQRYFDSEHNDASMMAEDVVFTDMTTGQASEGREAVLGMLNYIYHQAFDAHAATTNVIYGEGTAAIEADFIGKHTGEFAGIPSTGKEVNVPLAVTYDLKDDQITKARIFMQMPVMMAQLGVG